MIGAWSRFAFWEGLLQLKGKWGREVISLITGMAGCHHESTWAEQEKELFILNVESYF